MDFHNPDMDTDLLLGVWSEEIPLPILEAIERVEDLGIDADTAQAFVLERLANRLTLERSSAALDAVPVSWSAPSSVPDLPGGEVPCGCPDCDPYDELRSARGLRNGTIFAAALWAAFAACVVWVVLG